MVSYAVSDSRHQQMCNHSSNAIPKTSACAVRASEICIFMPHRHRWFVDDDKQPDTKTNTQSIGGPSTLSGHASKYNHINYFLKNGMKEHLKEK